MANEADQSPDVQVGVYGPFHRLKSPTQSIETAIRQRESGEIWGLTPRNGRWPQVQAYLGPLPSGWDGVEFYTNFPPDGTSHRRDRRWTGAPERSDIRNLGDFAILEVEVVRIIDNGMDV